MKQTLLLSALLAATVAPPASAAVDPFYQDLLRDGMHSFDRKDYGGAARDLRLACFGMLDEPKPLADCLVRLALAQDRAEDVEGFRDTFRRLVEVEERFNGYTQAPLPAPLRTALEQRLVARIPAPTLEGIAAFRGLVRKPAAPAAATKPVETAPPVPAPTVTATEPAPVTPAPTPITTKERESMTRARRLLNEKAAPRDLKQAFQLAREVADAHPDSAEAQHLAAEAAYRLSRWGDAAAYFRRGGDPGEGKPELLFYLAVALYESGDPAGAAAAIRRAIPNLRKTEYIEDYQKKILGSQELSGSRVQ
jgi:tetratricopeptide (TPR) repeat protein